MYNTPKIINFYKNIANVIDSIASVAIFDFYALPYKGKLKSNIFITLSATVADNNGTVTNTHASPDLKNLTD